MDIKTVLAIVSMVIAGVSAFYAYQISTQDSVNALTNRISDVEKDLVNVEGKQGPPGKPGIDGKDGVPGRDGSDAAFPEGAVVAFDRDDLTADKCPQGWTPFVRGRGRMIVGAGNPAAAPEKFAFGEDGDPLSNRDHRQHGGAEKHSLRVQELAKHRHFLFGNSVTPAGKSYPEEGRDHFAAVSGSYSQGNDYHYYIRKADPNKPPMFGVSGEEGNSAPHNNMPPYIALYFCKKEAG